VENKEERVDRRNRITISRSHAGEVNSTIHAQFKNPEIIIAAGSGITEHGIIVAILKLSHFIRSNYKDTRP
jgi:hypothetical protein